MQGVSPPVGVLPTAPQRRASLPPRPAIRAEPQPTNKLKRFENYQKHELASEATYLDEHSKTDALNQRVYQRVPQIKEAVKTPEKHELVDHISAVNTL